MERGPFRGSGLVLLTCLVFFCEAQGQFGPAEPWQVQGIHGALNDSLRSVQFLGLQKISSFSKVEGISPNEIIPFLRSGDPDLLVVAARALGTIGPRNRPRNSSSC